MDSRRSSGRLVLFFSLAFSVLTLGLAVAWLWSFDQYVAGAAQQMKAEDARQVPPFDAGMPRGAGPASEEAGGPEMVSAAAIGALLVLCVVLASSVAQATSDGGASS